MAQPLTSRPMLFVMVICWTLPRSSALWKSFVNSSSPLERATFVINFETSSVVCESTNETSAMQLLPISVLCDGKQDCAVSGAMDDEAFSYCRGGCPGDCSSRGACLHDGRSPLCFCDPGAHGPDCGMEDVNECVDKPCHWLARCTNRLGSYDCRCMDGFTGDGVESCVDVDECGSGEALCPSHSECVNLPGTFLCNCSEGFAAASAQARGPASLGRCEDVDECALGLARCPNGTLCRNSLGSYQCVSECGAGFRWGGEGSERCVEVDECAEDAAACPLRSVCVNEPPGSFQCLCESGFLADGDKCIPRSDCSVEPGVCDVQAFCVAELRLCFCESGYVGDGLECWDVDECASLTQPCADGRRCENLPGSFACCPETAGREECLGELGLGCPACGLNALCLNSTCACAPGFTGDPLRRCVDVDECSGAGGSVCPGASEWCVNTPGSFYCCDGRAGESGCHGLLIAPSNEGAFELSLLQPTDRPDLPPTTTPSSSSTQPSGQPPTTSPTPQSSVEPSSIASFSVSTKITVAGRQPTTVVPEGTTIEPTVAPTATSAPDIDEPTNSEAGATKTAGQPNTTTIQPDTTRPTSPTSESMKTSDSTTVNTSTESSPVGKDAGACRWSRDCGSNAECREGRCSCSRGFAGAPPEEPCSDVDECSSGEAECEGAGAVCENLEGSYACRCPGPGWRLEEGRCVDIDECSEAAPCYRAAVCRNSPGGYSCECGDGLQGDGYSCAPLGHRLCRLDESAAHCGLFRECFVSQMSGDVLCGTCASGFRPDPDLPSECMDVDECADESFCHEHASCLNLPATATCRCEDGFRGDGFHCEDVDECAEGRHSCHPQAACRNEPGSFACLCPEGWLGDGKAGGCYPPFRDLVCDCAQGEHCVRSDNGTACECPLGSVWDEESGSCEDRDPCAPSRHPCDGRTSECVRRGERGFVCECRDGYQGLGGVCVDVDECAFGYNGCDPNALCRNLPGSFECRCGFGLHGNGSVCHPDPPACPSDMDESCLKRHRSCRLDSLGRPSCGDCLQGFRADGPFCRDVDECAEPAPCDLNAVCANKEGGFDCACREGWSGDGESCWPEGEGSGDEAAECGRCDANAECREGTCVCAEGFIGDGRKCDALCPHGELPTLDGRRCGGPSDCPAAHRCVAGFCCPLRSLGSSPAPAPSPSPSPSAKSCLDGGLVCHREARCSGTGKCRCKEGYLGNGLRCLPDYDDCRLFPDLCHTNGRCDAADHRCRCSQGYQGDGKFCYQDPDYEDRPSTGQPEDGSTTESSRSEGTTPAGEEEIREGEPCEEEQRRGFCDPLASCRRGPDGAPLCFCPQGFVGNGRVCQRSIIGRSTSSRATFMPQSVFSTTPSSPTTEQPSSAESPTPVSVSGTKRLSSPKLKIQTTPDSEITSSTRSSPKPESSTSALPAAPTPSSSKSTGAPSLPPSLPASTTSSAPSPTPTTTTEVDETTKPSGASGSGTEAPGPKLLPLTGTGMGEGESDVGCYADGMSLILSSLGPDFAGRMFVAGQSRNPLCSRHFEPRRDGVYEFKAAFEHCHIVRSPGQRFAMRVVLQRHAEFVTAEAEAYQVECEYGEGRRQGLMSHYNVSEIGTEAVESAAEEAAVCSLRVLQPESGEAVSVASVGQRLRLLLAAEPQGVYQVLPRNCVAMSADESDAYPLTDARGCVSDGSLVPAFHLDPATGRAWTDFVSFKWPDSLQLRFQCDCAACVRGTCPPPPDCAPEAPGVRFQVALDEDFVGGVFATSSVLEVVEGAEAADAEALVHQWLQEEVGEEEVCVLALPFALGGLGGLVLAMAALGLYVWASARHSAPGAKLEEEDEWADLHDDALSVSSAATSRSLSSFLPR